MSAPPWSRAASAGRRALRLFVGDPARLELAVLILLLIGAAAGWSFVELADEMLEGETHEWDRRILLAMRADDPSDPLGPRWFEEAMRDVTGLGGLTVLALVTGLVAGFLAIGGRRAMSILVVLAIGTGLGLSTLLKQGFDRPRPDLVPHATQVYTASFPSGHALISAVTFLTLGALLARTQARWRLKVYVLLAAVLLTGAVGTSRVYLGVHWPSDVLAGWAAGSLWAAVCWLVAWRLQVIGAAEPEG